MRTWRERLWAEMPRDLAEEIDTFETQMQLRQQGKLDEKIFAELRLRRGVYGQRYDNGQRHDGEKTQKLPFPCAGLTKGPETVWDAPGMVRIKIPRGKVTVKQWEVMAELAEEYSDSILHVTTRQDIQLHFVHISDTPDLMRRLAAVGITTREACGNSVRNVTACQYANVCSTSAFDVSPYAHALTYFLLGHNDVQDFGRKLKIAFSGCKGEPCGLVNFHDIGLIAATKVENGKTIRGFEFYVGGGLGAVPQEAKLLDPFCSEEELLPLSQAVCRVFSRLGERKNRARARLKFVVQKLGIDEFRREVMEERTKLTFDPRWTSYLQDLSIADEKPVRAPSELKAGGSAEFTKWHKHNVRNQVQAGYATVTIRLPLGDITSEKSRAFATLAAQYSGDAIGLTVEQNLCLRWVPMGDLPALHADLKALGLAKPGAGSIVDVTSCPGTDTCKLGISSSRGLAGVLTKRLDEKTDLDERAEGLHIKASGCFNSCGQHHVADIGFLGVGRVVAGRKVAHFQLVVGGEWSNNGGTYGLAVGAFPSKNVPILVERLTQYWLDNRQENERFQAFVMRIGRGKVKEAMDDLRHVPAYEADPSYYVDWGDAREYTSGDMGVGECAGEVVSLTEFGLADSEREAFEALIHFDQGNLVKAAELANKAMVSAARALIRTQNKDVTEVANDVVQEFRTRFHDTQLFHDPFAGAKFAAFLFRAQEFPLPQPSKEEAHHRIEEAQLFIEAAHACYDRLQKGQATA